MVRVGIIGIGFMGMVHYLTYLKTRGAKVVAICETDRKRLAGDWRSIKGNFGPQGQKMNLSGVAQYAEVDKLLADPEVDLVDITLPPSLHAKVAVEALRCGKHVFCEKPMALSVRDCERMTHAAKRAKRLLLIGHVLPFLPEYQWALKTVRSGRYGKLLGGSFKRVISDPTWLTNYWSSKLVGGPMLDLHVHDAHYINLLFGKPKSLVCRGRMRNRLAENWHTQFDYGPRGPAVHAHSGTIGQQGRAFNHGFEIHLEKATLVFEFAVMGDSADYLCQPTILDGNGKIQKPKLSDGDPMRAFGAEIKEVAKSVRSNCPSAILDGSLARDAVMLCQKQTESLRRRCAVRV